MSRHLFARLAGAAVACGLLLALLVALATTGERRVASGASPAADPARPRQAAARPEPRGIGWAQLRATTPVRIVTRAADPRGGPDWVVRAFRGEVAWRSIDSTRGRSDWGACLQLGRQHEGRFGWIDAANVFRPVAVQQRGAPLRCELNGRRPLPVERLTRITDPTAGEVRPLQTVEWGRDRRGVATVRPHAGPAQPRLAERAAYRTPDPSGGLAWGIGAVRRADGGWCPTSPARVVGDQLGLVDYALGIVQSTSGMTGIGCRGQTLRATRARPIALMVAMSAGDAPDEPGRRAQRTARRTLGGQTTIYGIVDPSIRLLTFKTPRDVRTITPARSGNVFVVVYDDGFPTGDMVVIGRRADGSAHRYVLPGR